MGDTITSFPSKVPTRQTAFDYDRTLVAFHGTRRATAKKLIRGDEFGVSENDDDWLGHGIYFWEFAPQQAWWWARRRYGIDAAVVGSLVRLGHCLDLLDPSNATLLREAHGDLAAALHVAGQRLPANANNHKYLDCAVFNWLYRLLREGSRPIDSCRTVFVPLQQTKGMPSFGSAVGSLRELTCSSAYGSQRTSSRYGPCGRMDAMAKTSSKGRSRVGRQAAPDAWSPDDLVEAIRLPSLERKIELLREVGILDARGKLASKYRSWGKRVSRTESRG
jgi:hypothetical protein